MCQSGCALPLLSCRSRRPWSHRRVLRSHGPNAFPVPFADDHPRARSYEQSNMSSVDPSFGSTMKGISRKPRRDLPRKRQLRVVLDTNVLYTGSASDLVRQEIATVIQQTKYADLEVVWYLPDIVRHERQYQMQKRALELQPEQSHCFLEHGSACAGMGTRTQKMGCAPPRPHSVARSCRSCPHQCIGRLSSSRFQSTWTYNAYREIGPKRVLRPR
jgi:hypothetical protein